MIRNFYFTLITLGIAQPVWAGPLDIIVDLDRTETSRMNFISGAKFGIFSKYGHYRIGLETADWVPEGTRVEYDAEQCQWHIRGITTEFLEAQKPIPESKKSLWYAYSKGHKYSTLQLNLSYTPSNITGKGNASHFLKIRTKFFNAKKNHQTVIGEVFSYHLGEACGNYYAYWPKCPSTDYWRNWENEAPVSLVDTTSQSLLDYISFWK